MNAATTAPTEQIPPVYHRRIGDILVTAIGDGYLDGTVDVLRNIAKDEAVRLLTAAFRPARRTSVNCFLVRTKGRTALIETGCGTYMQPSAGKLLQSLAAAGVDPAAIDTLLLTHMHPDHSAGMTDRTTGKAFFANCELRVHENEPRHWLDDGEMARAPERNKLLYFQCAREQIAPYMGRLNTFTSGEVFPGVTAIPCHGHTPGHTSFLIQSGNDRLLIWGDTVHVPELQVPRPEVAMEFDTDNAAAIATRRRVFDMVATERLLVTGMHMHFPGFAHISRDGSGYRIHWEAWQQAL